MKVDEGNAPVLLVKKLGGLLLVLFGFLFLGLGFSRESTGLTLLGVFVLVCGGVLLALKIRARNQP